MDVAILGWHDGTAGQIDSWYQDDESINVRLFISHNLEPLEAKETPRPVNTFSYPEDGFFKKRPLILEQNWWEVLIRLEIQVVILAIDNRFDRVNQLENARKHGIKVANAIHPTAIISETAILGQGISIYPNVVVGYKAQIDDAVVINTGSSIDHHTRVMNGATIDPGCVLAGNVKVGEYVQIHTGTTITNKVNIAKNTEIGAGSLLMKDTHPDTLYFGSPARIVNTLN